MFSNMCLYCMFGLYIVEENSGSLVTSSIITKKNGSFALKTGRLPSRDTNTTVDAAASVPFSVKLSTIIYDTFFTVILKVYTYICMIQFLYIHMYNIITIKSLLL